MSGGVLDLTFLEISKDSELIERASEAVSKSKGSESPSKKQKEEWKAIRLGNNSIENLSLLRSWSDSSFVPSKILWLDLSFNQIRTITDDITNLFPNLTTLYLHANSISKLSDIKKLQSLSNVKSLTLYGNPVEENRHYRNMVLYIFPNLIQLDFCVITARQREKMSSWAQIHRKHLNPEE